jgi:dimethylargininase
MCPAVTQALVRHPPPNLAEGLTTQHLGRPDPERASAQHRAYIDQLRKLGVHVRELDSDARFPDCHFVEDTAVIYRGTAIPTVPGAASRIGEVDSIRSVLRAQLPIRELPRGADVRLDGGDVLVAGDHVLIGISASRTSLAGGQALRDLLQSLNPRMTVDLVPFRGVLHLKSGITALTPEVAVRDPAFETAAELPFAEVLLLPAAEGFAANVLPVNDAILVLDGSPTIREFAHRYSDQVFPLAMDEFRKMDGSLTCLSLLW